MILLLAAALFLAGTSLANYNNNAAVDLDGDSINIYDSAMQAVLELNSRRLASTLEESETPQIMQRATSVCYDELGCFDKEGTFKHLKQLPEPPETVNTQFLLYTRKNKLEPQFLDYKKPDTIFQSHIDPKLPLKIITHGFGGKNNLTWVWEMKNAFLEKMDVNVLVVDWSLGAKVPYYIQAAVNSELVGAQTAVLFFFLKDNLGFQESNLHCVGFSLGAHVVGFIGKRMQDLRGTRPSRITGLDPASPLYEDYGGEVHLYKDDADFVDVIHTNADLLIYGGVGILVPIGHVDYYPNGGKRQPGCGSTIKGALLDIFKGDRERACNHERAVHLFTDSILMDSIDCKYTAFSCANYSDFELGRCLSCGDECGQMGYHTKGSGVYYLMTRPEKPYCADIAKLKVSFPKSIKKSYGKIILQLRGANGDRENITITEKDEKLSPGAHKEFALTVNDILKTLKSVEIIYLRYNGWFTKGAETFGVASVTIVDTKGQYIFKSCGEDIILKDNQYQFLKETDANC